MWLSTDSENQPLVSVLAAAQLARQHMIEPCDTCFWHEAMLIDLG